MRFIVDAATITGYACWAGTVLMVWAIRHAHKAAKRGK